MSQRINQAKINIQKYPQVKSVDPYPLLVLYADKDGLEYFYTIWHLEQMMR